MSPGSVRQLKIQRRFQEPHTIRPEGIRGLPDSHPAVVEGRTIFPTTVVDPNDSPRLLISGLNQRKLGDRVIKGKWKGMPIFCLTLEERATCPRSCYHWRSCYGNGMHLARRHKAGPALEYLLAAELAEKQEAFPDGFVVRLHILGDFYDAAYAELWGRWLDQFPGLRVFGFTGREEDSDIGFVIRANNLAHPDRFVIRFSRADAPPAGNARGARYATTIWRTPDAPTVGGAVVCPVQTGRTAACGSCGLCWTGDKTIAFIAHGQNFTKPDEAAANDEIDPSGVKLPTIKQTLHHKPRGRPRINPPAQTGTQKQSCGRVGRPKTSNVKRALNQPGVHQNSGDQLPTVAVGELDPEHFVPATLTDVHNWCMRAGLKLPFGLGPAGLLRLANAARDREKLPRFRPAGHIWDSLDDRDLPEGTLRLAGL